MRSSEEQINLKSSFPNFIWLIRDATLCVTDKNEKPITPTEYLRTQVLVSNHGGKLTDQDCTINAINRLFPSIECHTLPRPSAEVNILTSMSTNEDCLDPEFNNELCTFRELVLRKLKLKMLSNQECKNGLVMAALLTSFVGLINSGSKIVLGDAYSTAVEGILLKRLEVLTNEYQHEMEELLQGKYPMEEYTLNDNQDNQTLFTYHEKVMKSKKCQFEMEIDNFLPTESSRDLKESLKSLFVDDICKFTRHEDVMKIEGGKLYQFALSNLNASKQFCEELSMKVFRDITDRIEGAILGRTPLELSDELLSAERLYYREAVGPAKDKVCAQKRDELSKKCSDVSSIPSRPFGVCISGTDRNRIKLQWESAGEHNYEIQCMSDKTSWTTLPNIYQERWAIIESLESNSEYIFCVRAVSETSGHGNWSEEVSTKTTKSFLQQGAVVFGTFLGGTLASPLFLLFAAPLGGPISVASGVVAAPVLGTIMARQMAKHLGPTGDFADKACKKEKLDGDTGEQLVTVEVGNIQVVRGEESGEEGNDQTKEQ